MKKKVVTVVDSDRHELMRQASLGKVVKILDPINDPISPQVIDDCIKIYGPRRVIHGLIRYAERSIKIMSRSPAAGQSKEFWSRMIRGYKKILEVGWNERSDI